MLIALQLGLRWYLIRVSIRFSVSIRYNKPPCSLILIFCTTTVLLVIHTARYVWPLRVLSPKEFRTTVHRWHITCFPTSCPLCLQRPQFRQDQFYEKREPKIVRGSRAQRLDQEKAKLCYLFTLLMPQCHNRLGDAQSAASRLSNHLSLSLYIYRLYQGTIKALHRLY
jgi:hypothetical protein